MSRMTKYLKQTCSVETYQTDAQGKPILDRYGDPLSNPPSVQPCRYEESFKDVQTSNGALVKSTARYFLDGSVRIRADDKIDGRAVLVVASYINQFGKSEGYEAYV